MQAEIERFVHWVRMRSPEARTWRDYQCDLGLFMSLMQDRTVEEIRIRDLDDFVNHQVGKGYKPSTVNRRLAAVASFYTYLIGEGWQITSPVLPRRHYLKEPQRLPRPVGEPDLRKFFGAIREVRDRAMCTLMLRCGLRIGEVAELRMVDLYLGELPSRMIIRGKGSRERTVYLSPEAECDLKVWLATRAKVPCKYVFMSYQQKRLSTTSLSNRIQHIRKLSGVNLTAHRLRHTFADHLLSAGMPITSIQKLMGHRFVETTQNYAMANDKQVASDFYVACKKIEGWKLLVEAVQPEGPEYEADIESQLDLAEDTSDCVGIHFEVPASAACLPSALVQQLEAYRQLKANRWRFERVTANSRNFYSMQIAIWKFFGETCSVRTALDLRLEHVLQYVQHRLDTKCSPKTVNGNLSALRSFLSFLKEDGVEIHPSLENIKRLKEPEQLPRYMTSEQVQRLRDEIEADTLKEGSHLQKYDTLLIRSAFYLFWQGGLRSGEVEDCGSLIFIFPNQIKQGDCLYEMASGGRDGSFISQR